MGRDHRQFEERGVAIISAMGERTDETESYHRSLSLPFPMLKDPSHIIYDSYSNWSALRSGGHMPAVVLIDKHGVVRYTHFYAGSNPTTKELLAEVENIFRN